MRTPEMLFPVNLSTVEGMFSHAGRGFYIPPYQRQYTWGNEEIDRLIEDLCIGLQSWLNDSDIVTFLGNIILIKDELFDQVEPAIKEHLPAEVMIVIDGQQRLTTLSILGVLLHDEVVRCGNKLRKKEFPGDSWLKNRYEQTAFQLRPLFELYVGFGECLYYPKIIRAYQDQWSREVSTSRYKSPIGQFLDLYVTASRGEATARPFKPELNDAGGKIIEVVVRAFRKHLANIVDGKGPEDEPIFPSHQPFPRTTQKHVFKDELPEELERFVTTDAGGEACGLLHLVAFANYLLTRCSVTLTRPTEDRFAFELFERLNATGQQLTAYETFRPFVVKAEGLTDYRNSDAHGWIAEVDAFVPVDLPYDKRSRTTHDLLLPFAMAQKGDRLAKRLGQQRNWMRKTFEGLPELAHKRRFVCELRNLVRFLDEGFQYNKPEVTPSTHIGELQVEDDGLTVLCLDYLKHAKNEICIGPLSRFYSEVLHDPGLQRSGAFGQAVKASAAFFTLYRWAFGTSGLPDAYRRLMRVGDPDNDLHPMGRLVENSQMPSGEAFAAYLGRQLRSRLNGAKDEWVKRVKLRPIYQSSVVAKFALFTAFHDTIADEEAAGQALPCQSKTGSLEMLTLAQWCEQPEVEHIAPHTRRSGWTEDLYDGDTLDLIGNLVLLPKAANNSANNKSWERKRLYYRVLGSPENVSTYMDSDEVIELGVDLSVLTPTILQMLRDSKYHAYLAPIADVTDSWNAELVHRRSERLASLVWDRLAPWIGFEL